MKCVVVPGASLGILLLSLLDNASMVLADTRTVDALNNDDVTAKLDLGEWPALSYSKKVTRTVVRWAKETQKCTLKLEIRYKNECNRLTSIYETPSCGGSQWLVLEKPGESDRGRYFPVKPKCVEKRCDFPEFWWSPLDKCIDKDISKKVCGERNIFDSDPFGDTYCKCRPFLGQLTEGADCYAYYQQGPCKIDEVLVFDVGSGLGKCAPDLCYAENLSNAADEDKIRSGENNSTIAIVRKMFAPLGGTGKCIDFRSSDGCITKTQHGSFMFKIDDETNLPTCSFYSLSRRVDIFVPYCPYYDEKTKKCPGNVSAKLESREIYDRANRGSFDDNRVTPNVTR